MFQCRSNTEEFIEKAIRKHGDRYDYSAVNYTTAITKVSIICRGHGVFYQTPNGHLCGHGCPRCANENANRGRNDICKNAFIDRARQIHGSLYDYSLVNYIGARVKIDIICPIHGIFKQTPNSHLRGSGCGYCKGVFIHKAKRHNKDIFIEKARSVHGDCYNYDLVEYYNARTKVKITCPTHGVFEQAPHLHLRGERCPKCHASSGERGIGAILDDMGIPHEKQKTFPTCRAQRALRFDFYLVDTNILIEYQGQQHFAPHEWLGGLSSFMQTRRNDEIKKVWAMQNGYILKEYRHDDLWDYIARSIRGTYAYYKNNRPKT